MPKVSLEYGCYNRNPLPKTTWVQDGWIECYLHGAGTKKTRVPRMVEIPIPFEDKCKQWGIFGLPDKYKCIGCKHAPPVLYTRTVGPITPIWPQMPSP